MIENFKENSKNKRDYNSELILNILNAASMGEKNNDAKELFVDENWRINSNNMNNIISSDNSSLKKILSEIFPDKKILIQDNKYGSQTIFIS